MKIKIDENFGEGKSSKITILFPGLFEKTVEIIVYNGAKSPVEVRYKQLEKFDSGSLLAMSEALAFAAYVAEQTKLGIPFQAILFYTPKTRIHLPFLEVLEYMQNGEDILLSFLDMNGGRKFVYQRNY